MSSSKAVEKTQEPISVKVHHHPLCKVELEVTASKEIISQARKNAIKWVSKGVSFPGFRKGKAPESVVLRERGAEVEKRFQKELADLAFIEAQKKANVPVLNNNSPISFDLKKRSDEEALLSFTFETEPKVPTVDRETFEKKPVPRAEVGEKQIEEAIRQMRFFFAKWTPVKDRAIQDGDYVLIDLDTVEKDKVERIFNQVRFEVSKERMANWMKKLIEGAKVGDVLEGVSEADDMMSEEEKKEFQPKNVRITLVQAEEAELPEVNDEFAKKVGAETVEKMRESVTNLLNKQADEKVETSLREQINEFLLKNYEFELPKSLIDAEKKHRMEQKKMDPNFIKMSEEEKKKFEESLHSQAEEAVRLFYLSRQIVKDAKIAITHQEVQNEAVQTYSYHGGKNPDQVPREIFALALSKVVLFKAQSHILKKA